MEQHHCADLPAMACAVGNDMRKHFFAGHAAGFAVGEHEVDPFRQLVGIQRRPIVDIFLVASSDVRCQIFQRRHVTGIGRRV